MILKMRCTSFCRLAVQLSLLGAVALAPLGLVGQTSSDPTAPTKSVDPAAIDQAWQKASYKYDAQRSAILKEVDQVNHDGPYRADWQSLETYQVPDWYKDAKFGIFIHWGVFSVPAFGSEWYPRQMYRPGFGRIQAPRRNLWYAGQIRLQGFHPHVQSGDISIQRHGRGLFKEAGAKYVVPVFEHHDGFRYV